MMVRVSVCVRAKWGVQQKRECVDSKDEWRTTNAAYVRKPSRAAGNGRQKWRSRPSMRNLPRRWIA